MLEYALDAGADVPDPHSARRGDAAWLRDLRAGTLYAALDRLRADDLVEVDHEEIVEGRLRRYHRLSDEGSRQLAAEAARLQANATAAVARLSAARGLA